MPKTIKPKIPKVKPPKPPIRISGDVNTLKELRSMLASIKSAQISDAKRAKLFKKTINTHKAVALNRNNTIRAIGHAFAENTAPATASYAIGQANSLVNASIDNPSPKYSKEDEYDKDDNVGDPRS